MLIIFRNTRSLSLGYTATTSVINCGTFLPKHACKSDMKCLSIALGPRRQLYAVAPKSLNNSNRRLEKWPQRLTNNSERSTNNARSFLTTLRLKALPVSKWRWMNSISLAFLIPCMRTAEDADVVASVREMMGPARFATSRPIRPTMVAGTGPRATRRLPLPIVNCRQWAIRKSRAKFRAGTTRRRDNRLSRVGFFCPL